MFHVEQVVSTPPPLPRERQPAGRRRPTIAAASSNATSATLRHASCDTRWLEQERENAIVPSEADR
jgi:hypothetical protein